MTALIADLVMWQAEALFAWSGVEYKTRTKIFQLQIYKLIKATQSG